MAVKLVIKENLIEAKLVRAIAAAGGVCEKTAAIGTRGFFDRIAVFPNGNVVFIECKRPRGGRISLHQLARHERYRALNAIVAIVRNEEDIDRLMQTHSSN